MNSVQQMAPNSVSITPEKKKEYLKEKGNALA